MVYKNIIGCLLKLFKYVCIYSVLLLTAGILWYTSCLQYDCKTILISRNLIIVGAFILFLAFILFSIVICCVWKQIKENENKN